MSSLTWDEKVKKFGQPIFGKTYNCKIKNYHSGKIVNFVLKAVDEDDCLWRTADDNSEVDEWNWDVIEWIAIN